MPAARRFGQYVLNRSRRSGSWTDFALGGSPWGTPHQPESDGQKTEAGIRPDSSPRYISLPNQPLARVAATDTTLPSMSVVTLTPSPFFRSTSLASFPSSVTFVVAAMVCECSLFPSLSDMTNFPSAAETTTPSWVLSAASADPSTSASKATTSISPSTVL